MHTRSPNRPQCTRIITASPSPSNPEAAFSSRDTLVHNFEIALRRQGPLSACGKMAKSILPTIHSSDLPQRVPGSSLPKDFDADEGNTLGPQSRKTSTPSLTATTSSPFSASSPHTPSHESYTYTSSTYTSPVLTTHRSPVTRSRSGSHASTSYAYSISASPTIRHNALALPIGQKVPKWREAMGHALSPSSSNAFDEIEEAETDQISRYYHCRQHSVGASTRRAPAGPRPMLRTPPRSSLSVSTLSSSTLTVGRRTLRESTVGPESGAVGLGLGFDQASEAVPVVGDARGQERRSSSSPSSSSEPSLEPQPRPGTGRTRAYRERRKAIDFGSQGQLSVDALSCSISLASSSSSSPPSAVSPRSGSLSGSESSEEGQELVVREDHDEEGGEGEWTRGPTTAQIDKAMREVEEELFSYRSSYHEGGWRSSALGSPTTSARSGSRSRSVYSDHEHEHEGFEGEEEEVECVEKLEEWKEACDDGARDDFPHARDIEPPSPMLSPASPASPSAPPPTLTTSTPPPPSPSPPPPPPPLSRTSVDSVSSEVYTVPPYPNSPPHYQTQFPHLAVSESGGSAGGISTATATTTTISTTTAISTTTTISTTSTTSTSTATTPLMLRTTLPPERHPAHPVSPKSPIALPTLTVLIPGREGLPLPLPPRQSSLPSSSPPPSLQSSSSVSQPQLPSLPPIPFVPLSRAHSLPAHPPPMQPLPSLPSLPLPHPNSHSHSHFHPLPTPPHPPPLPAPALQPSPVSAIRLQPEPPIMLSSSSLSNENENERVDNDNEDDQVESATVAESFGGQRSAFDSDSDEEGDGSVSGRRRRFGGKFLRGGGGIGYNSNNNNNIGNVSGGSGNGSGGLSMSMSVSVGMGKLRKAIRSSVSMEGVGGNLRKGRLSFVGSVGGGNGNGGGPSASASTPVLPSATTTTTTATTATTSTTVEKSVTESPESVSSLRARQLTTSSSSSFTAGFGGFAYSRNGYAYGQCPPTMEQGTSLSPIPATPLETVPPKSLEDELVKVDWTEGTKRGLPLDVDVGLLEEEREGEDGDESELPTPVTPAVERTKSFIAQLARLPNSPLTVTIPAVPSIPRMLPPPPTSLPAHPRLSSLAFPNNNNNSGDSTPTLTPTLTPTVLRQAPHSQSPRSFFSRPSVQAKVDLLALKASGRAPPNMPLPPTPDVQMELSVEAVKRQTELEVLDIDRWRAQVLVEAEAEAEAEAEEREREEERERMKARIRVEEEELEQVLAAEERERERVGVRRGGRQGEGEREKEKEEYGSRLTVVDPEESMVKLEMSMAKLEAYAPSVVLPLEGKDEVQEDEELVEGTKPAEENTRDEVAQVIPVDSLKEPSSLTNSPRPPPNTPNTPSSTFTSPKPHTPEVPSKPAVPPKDPIFATRLRLRQAKSSAPPTAWMPEGPTPSSSSTAGGLVLPKFDFEAPDHKVLDIRGMGLRAESRLGYRPSIEDVPEVPPEAPIQAQPNSDEFLDEEPVLLVPLRRRPSCLPDLRTNDSLVSFDSGLSSSYSTISANTAAETQRAKSLKLKDTKLKVRKLFGRIAERTESIRERVPLPQVALQNPFAHGQVKLM